MRQRRSSSLLIACVLIFSLLSSCSTPTPQPTATSLPPTETPIPASPTPQPSPTATAVPVPTRAQYSLNVVLDYAGHALTADETIVYPNHSGQNLTELVLAVEPNFWPGCFTLDSLSLDGAAVADYTLNEHKLSIPLANVMKPEATARLQLQFSLALPQIVPDPSLPPRIFGYTKNQINLTNWYPFVVPYMGGQWILHDPVGFAAEHLVYDAADFMVNLKLADPAVTPIIASSGAPAANGEWTTYTLTAGRSFALSASTEFLTASTQVGDVTLTSYYLQPLFKGSGEAALNASAQAMQIYSQRYGPYPHKTLAIVMGDFSDSKEFSALYFHSRNFYEQYDGTQRNYLTFVAAHETAHQWWFEQVANDQALQPWLDEALATYSEHVFYESVDPQIVSWWWIYRIDFYNPQGWLDVPIYAAGGFRPYTNAVYFRGAHFLDDLRKRLGDEAFFGFLQDYLQQENGKIATSLDFFRILSQHTQTDYSDIERLYFQNVY